MVPGVTAMTFLSNMSHTIVALYTSQTMLLEDRGLGVTRRDVSVTVTDTRPQLLFATHI